MKRNSKLIVLFVLMLVLVFTAVACGGSKEITFDTQGGEPAVASVKFEKGETITEPTGVAKTGFTLVGWYDNKAGNGDAFDFSKAPQKAMTLYAIWGYNVTFDLTGGGDDIVVKVKAGGKVTAPVATKEGYSLKGFTTAKSQSDLGGIGNPVDFANISISKDITYYAKWEIATSTVSFDLKGGKYDGEATIDSVTSDTGAPLTLPAANLMKKDDRLFGGWFKDENCTIAATAQMPAGTTTLYASWVKEDAAARVNMLATLMPSPNGTEHVVTNTVENSVLKYVKIATAAAKGDWSCIVVPFQFNAKEYKVKYTLTGTSGKEIMIKLQQGGITVDAGEVKVTMDGTKQSGILSFTRDQLTDGSRAAEFVLFVNPGNSGAGTEVTFEELRFERYINENSTATSMSTITFFGMGGNRPAVISGAVGDAVVLPAAANMTGTPGYYFDGWYNEYDCSGTAVTLTTMPAGPTDLYAKWTANASKTITFNTTHSGATGASAVANYEKPVGSLIYAPADPAYPGHTFGGWYTEAACTTAYVFDKMPETNTELFAKWTVNANANVTFDSNFAGSATVDGTNETKIETAPFGTVLVLPTPVHSNVGFVFVGWYKDQACTTANFVGNDGDNYTVPQAGVTLYAKWEGNIQYTLTFDAGTGYFGSVTTEHTTDLSGNANTAVAEIPTAKHTNDYIFAGWYNENTYTTEFSGNYPLANDATVYAKWTKYDNNTEYSLVLTGWTVANNRYSASGATYTIGNRKAEYDAMTTAIDKVQTSGFTTIIVEYSLSDAMNVMLKVMPQFNGGNIERTFENLPAGAGRLVWTLSEAQIANSTEFLIMLAPGIKNSSATPTNAVGSITLTKVSFCRIVDEANNDVALRFNTGVVGQYVNAIYAANGATIVLPGVTEHMNPGYTFAGWYNENTFDTVYNSTTMPSANKTVYAKWEKNANVNVTFMNGATEVKAKDAYAIGTAINSNVVTTPAAAAMGQFFGGWWTKNGDAFVEKVSYIPDSNTDIVLYARWAIGDVTTAYLPVNGDNGFSLDGHYTNRVAFSNVNTNGKGDFVVTQIEADGGWSSNWFALGASEEYHYMVFVAEASNADAKIKVEAQSGGWNFEVYPFGDTNKHQIIQEFNFKSGWQAMSLYCNPSTGNGEGFVITVHEFAFYKTLVFIDTLQA